MIKIHCFTDVDVMLGSTTGLMDTVTYKASNRAIEAAKLWRATGFCDAQVTDPAVAIAVRRQFYSWQNSGAPEVIVINACALLIDQFCVLKTMMAASVPPRTHP